MASEGNLARRLPCKLSERTVAAVLLDVCEYIACCMVMGGRTDGHVASAQRSQHVPRTLLAQGRGVEL